MNYCLLALLVEKVTVFDGLWPQMEKRQESIPAKMTAVAHRSADEMISEVLELSRFGANNTMKAMEALMRGVREVQGVVEDVSAQVSSMRGAQTLLPATANDPAWRAGGLPLSSLSGPQFSVVSGERDHELEEFKHKLDELRLGLADVEREEKRRKEAAANSEAKGHHDKA
jgi:hypothetical protein